MTSYNPWPLGALPEEWQRQEPYLIRELGYSWDDPRQIVGIFEKKLADYAGSKYAITTDCCSNAIFLCLKYLNYHGTVQIPKQTYVSVPMQIIHAGASVEFIDKKWSGVYDLLGTNIIDGAGRFRKGMYENKESLQILSFQIKKRLPIGKGGAILTNSKEAYDWLKYSSYDGRDLNSPYDSIDHVKSLGWHFYMTPEDAARGILIMDQLGEDLPDVMSYSNYPDLTQMSVFRK
jgi:dTDP-4-amino-4,6-dideoxygalactose transaminase